MKSNPLYVERGDSFDEDSFDEDSFEDDVSEPLLSRADDSPPLLCIEDDNQLLVSTDDDNQPLVSTEDNSQLLFPAEVDNHDDSQPLLYQESPQGMPVSAVPAAEDMEDDNDCDDPKSDQVKLI